MDIMELAESIRNATPEELQEALKLLELTKGQKIMAHYEINPFYQGQFCQGCAEPTGQDELCALCLHAAV